VGIFDMLFFRCFMVGLLINFLFGLGFLILVVVFNWFDLVLLSACSVF
jgi:hypothetical protein